MTASRAQGTPWGRSNARGAPSCFSTVSGPLGDSSRTAILAPERVEWIVCDAGVDRVERRQA